MRDISQRYLENSDDEGWRSTKEKIVMVMVVTKASDNVQVTQITMETIGQATNENDAPL